MFKKRTKVRNDKASILHSPEIRPKSVYLQSGNQVSHKRGEQPREAKGFFEAFALGARGGISYPEYIHAALSFTRFIQERSELRNAFYPGEVALNVEGLVHG